MTLYDYTYIVAGSSPQPKLWQTEALTATHPKRYKAGMAQSEMVWVKCKGFWCLGETVGYRKHEFRMVRMLQACCFEHGVGKVLMVPPNLYAKAPPEGARILPPPPGWSWPIAQAVAQVMPRPAVGVVSAAE